MEAYFWSRDERLNPSDLPIKTHSFDGIYWTATLANYDGPPAPCGSGMSEDEAILDLLEKIDDSC